jgi:drug/metabolite transporter (DMT)-like permease
VRSRSGGRSTEAPLTSRAIAHALAAAVLFGLSTPAAKMLLAATDPRLLAGILYLGSGLGLGAFRVATALGHRDAREAPLRWQAVPWLLGAILTGGALGPLLLLFGLAQAPATQASLLLNLEGVLTLAIAWLVFREPAGLRIVLGMAAITAGAVVLSWQADAPRPLEHGALLVVGACLAWAVDNNLTRKVAGGDPVLIAALKGGVAGAANLAIALAAGVPFPAVGVVLAGGVVGLFGYGVSLVLFVRALRELGAARTSAYFSTAPFIGALASVALLGDHVDGRLVVGGLFMAIGVWLHVTERHAHEHVHEPLEHEHLHDHDAHHQHHPPGTPAPARHSHPHVHAPQRHSHAHYPDLHHRHPH